VIFQKKLEGHGNTVSTFQITKSNEILISVSADKTCKAWNIGTGQCFRTFIGHTDQVIGLAVISDNIFATCSKEVMIWNIKSDSPIQTINQKNMWICHIAIT